MDSFEQEGKERGGSMWREEISLEKDCVSKLFEVVYRNNKKAK